MKKVTRVGLATLVLSIASIVLMPSWAIASDLQGSGGNNVGSRNLGDPIGTLALPSPAGDAWMLADAGSNLFWHASYSSSDTAYLINTNGEVISSFSFAVETGEPGGITTDGTFVYISDNANDQIQIYSATGVFQSSVAVAGTLHGITFNPNTGNLYIVDYGAGTVLERTTAGAAVNTYNLTGGGNAHRGIEYDAQRNGYWVVDEIRGIVELYSLDFSVVRQSFSVAPGSHGVAVKGNKLYVSDQTVAYIFDITEFQLAVPFFLDNGTNLSGSLPTSGVAAFIGVKNMSARSITLTIVYTEDDGDDATPVSNTFVLGPNQAVSWRPGADDPSEGGGQAVPNKAGGFPAGSVLITADGPITGRIVELDGDNSLSRSYTLPKP